jgi:NAD-dependent dihydropyrimidine dehydrogenase PreA subunit
MAYVVTDACVDILDQSCVEECPVDCIYQGDRMMYIHPDECVDCGKCMPAHRTRPLRRRYDAEACDSAARPRGGGAVGAAPTSALPL